MFKIQLIKDLISEKKISLNDFSEKIGKTYNTVYNYFNGKTTIDVETLQKIADVLGVPIIYFFGVETRNCQEVIKENENLKKEKRLLEREKRLIESERVHLIKELASSMFHRFVFSYFLFLPEGLKNEDRFDYLVNEISNEQNYEIYVNENLRMPKELKEEVILEAFYHYNQRHQDNFESIIAMYIGMLNGLKNEAKNDTK